MDVEIKSNINLFRYLSIFYATTGRIGMKVYMGLTNKVVTKVNVDTITAALRDHIDGR